MFKSLKFNAILLGVFLIGSVFALESVSAKRGMEVAASIKSKTPALNCQPSGPDFWCNGHQGCFGPSDCPPCLNPHFYRQCNWMNWGTNYQGGQTPGGSVGIRVDNDGHWVLERRT